MFSIVAWWTISTLIPRFLLPITAQELSQFRPSPAIYSFPDSYVLSELPLSALLKVKKSVNEIICTGRLQARSDDSSSCPAPDFHHPRRPFQINETRLNEEIKRPTEDSPSSRTFSDLKDLFSGDLLNPRSEELYDHRKTYASHDHHHGDVWKSEGSGKIQKLFQFSVTALAFLAFGGYLLCMIVQAIKSKGTYYYPPSTSSYYASAIKKKRPIFSYGKRKRRRRRSASEDSEEEEEDNENDDVPNNNLNSSADLDLMYNGLISAISLYVNSSYVPV